MVSRKHEQADRVTILIEEKVNAKIQNQLAKNIMEAARDPKANISTSYSRVLNDAIEEAFAKGIDKKILSDANGSTTSH